MKKLRSVMHSFKFAGQGFKTAFINERNFRIHCAMVVIVTILGIVFSLPLQKWALLFLAVGFVLVSELVNTAGETLVDMITKEYSREAKMVKDLCAASVLVAAITAVGVGIFIFAEPILELLKRVILYK